MDAWILPLIFIVAALAAFLADPPHMPDYVKKILIGVSAGAGAALAYLMKHRRVKKNRKSLPDTSDKKS